MLLTHTFSCFLMYCASVTFTFYLSVTHLGCLRLSPPGIVDSTGFHLKMMNKLKGGVYHVFSGA